MVLIFCFRTEDCGTRRPGWMMSCSNGHSKLCFEYVFAIFCLQRSLLRYLMVLWIARGAGDALCSKGPDTRHWACRWLVAMGGAGQTLRCLSVSEVANSGLKGRQQHDFVAGELMLALQPNSSRTKMIQMTMTESSRSNPGVENLPPVIKAGRFDHCNGSPLDVVKKLFRNFMNWPQIPWSEPKKSQRENLSKSIKIVPTSNISGIWMNMKHGFTYGFTVHRFT